MRFCRKNILLLIFSSFISVGLGQDCDEGFVWIDDPPLNEYNWDGYNCFYELDLNVLSEFIQLNSSLSGQHLDIGWQYWVNGRLEGLTLYALQLTSIPNNIGSLNNLTYLNLHFNQITNIPETIGELTQLTEIYLENNLFGILPESIGNLTNLITLNINENQLTSIPENIGNLTGLEKLLLYNNSLTSLPESICNIFSNLSQYDFSDNYICPPYPYCIENVGYQDTSECEDPSLCDEGYIEIDGECYYQSDLDVLQQFIDLNLSLNGEEPLEIGDQEWNNTRLTYLGLGNRSLTTIPDNIGNLNHLEYLFLSSNQFSILPESIGNLSSLKFLFLGHNLFTVLPNTIGDLSNLESLYLHYNHLFILPDTICNLPQNCSPYLHNNYLCPPYPECLTEGDIGYQDTSECEEIDLGDINGDDSVDILDIVILVNYILSGDTSELDGADINNDGEVNILDVVQLVNIILGVTENTVTDIDGNVYETVQIGGQLWMAENLKVTHYQNSDEIPYIYNDPQYGAYINYNNNDDNVAVYGRLYNWFAVNDERGLCPDNWHVPSDDEFKSLEMYLGMSESEANGEGLRGTDEGGKLKEEGNEHWNSPNTGATNETGFTALPGGNRRYETYTNQEIFSGLNRYGFFWSSSEVYTVNAWYRVFSFDYSESNRYHLSKTNAFSIRCVED